MSKSLFGYPQPVGATKMGIFYHSGPASYVQTTFAPLANADTVRPAEADMKYFDVVSDGVDDSGQWAVEAAPLPANDYSATNRNGMSAGNTGFMLRWIARRTATIGGQAQTAGTEAAALTNLSTFNVRLQAFGRY